MDEGENGVETGRASLAEDREGCGAHAGFKVGIGARSDWWGQGGAGDRSGPRQAKAYRAEAARANCLGLDRHELQFAVKEACRTMSSPSAGDCSLLKRIGRYLLHVPEAAFWSRFDAKAVDGAAIFSDDDWDRRNATRGPRAVSQLSSADMRSRVGARHREGWSCPRPQRGSLPP